MCFILKSSFLWTQLTTSCSLVSFMSYPLLPRQCGFSSSIIVLFLQIPGQITTFPMKSSLISIFFPPNNAIPSTQAKSPLVCSLPGSSIHGIFQARVLLSCSACGGVAWRGWAEAMRSSRPELSPGYGTSDKLQTFIRFMWNGNVCDTILHNTHK